MDFLNKLGTGNTGEQGRVESVKNFIWWILGAIWPFFIVGVVLIVVQFVYTWYTGAVPDIWEYYLALLIMIAAKLYANTNPFKD